MTAPADAGVLIAGAGPAGVACAETLRAEGYGGSILLAGRELDPPYERPPVSKGYLAGTTAREDCLLHPPGFWAEQGIDLRVRTSVMKLDPEARTAKLSTGDEVRFEHALLATGAMVRRLRLDGAQLQGIHYLRALGNADALRADAEGAGHVVLVGGSYVACEVAATLASAGRRCTMVMLEPAPLSAGFGERVGAHFARLLGEHGVELLTGEEVARFEGGERVERVVCASGRSVDADVVVMGTGAVPDVMLARASGLELSERGGIACDASLRTSAPAVWAAGDACEYDSVLHGRRIRIEHWEAARAQGAHAARAMLGASDPFAEVPYFWSDLADWATLEYVGGTPEWDEEVVRGAFEDGAFSVLYLSGGRVVGALSVGRGEDLAAARRLIADRVEVSAADLAAADLAAL